MDSIYSPVLKVTYRVEATRVEQRTDFDKLVVDVETKPSILPRDAMASAGKTLVELFGLARELNVDAEGIEVGPSPQEQENLANFSMPIEEMELTVRSYNCLKREGIHTVGELISRSEADLLDIRNFGAKSIDEVKMKLAQMGLALKDSPPGFDPSHVVRHLRHRRLRQRRRLGLRRDRAALNSHLSTGRTAVMPQPTKGPRLGGGPAHQRLMLANLATSLFEHGSITTTEAKAKRLRPLAERLITFAKKGDLHARRQVMTVVRDKDVVHTLFAEIGPRLRAAAGWLHPHHQGRPAQGRQRADGGHRAGRGADRGPGGGRRGGAGARHPVPVPPGADPGRRARPGRRAAGADRPGRRPRRRGGRGAGAAEADGAECRRGPTPTAAAEAEADRGRRPTRRLRTDAATRLAAEDEADADDGSLADGARRRAVRRGRGHRRQGLSVPAPYDDEPAAPSGDGGLVRVRLAIAYDGGGFSGWAAQPGPADRAGRAGGGAGPAAAGAGGADGGRPDRRRRARRRPGRARRPARPPRTGPSWCGGWPGCCRRTSGSGRVEPAPAGFDARFSALWRRYAYRVVDDPAAADPLRRYDTLTWPRPLDRDAMQAAADRLLGEHDFAAFCRRREGATTIRSLQQLDWARDPAGVLTATVRADAFCHSMVRSLVGALLAVGEGRRPPDWPAAQLARTDRSGEVTVAPAARPDPASRSATRPPPSSPPAPDRHPHRAASRPPG